MRLCQVMKTMLVVENRFNNDEFFADTADTPEKDVEQHGKQECLKGPINKRKALSNRKAMDTRKR